MKRVQARIEIEAESDDLARLRLLLPEVLGEHGFKVTRGVTLIEASTQVKSPANSPREAETSGGATQEVSAPMRAKRTPAERFWAKVDKSGECWLWIGYVEKNGYGKFYADGRPRWAHRWIWQFENRVLTMGECVLHRCDNPRCVRPDHLFIGTLKDNARDMTSKGRAALQRNPRLFAGERHWTHRRPELIKRGEVYRLARKKPSS